jgi:uncharacterized protein (DUF362 family)
MPLSSDRFDATAGLSRRAFLAASTLSLVAAASGCRPRPYDARAFQRLERSPVTLLPAASYAIDFADLIGRGLSDLGIDVRNRRVFLKPNLVEYEVDSAINTDPMVIMGAVSAFRSAGAASVVVAEGPGHRRDTEYLLASTGLYEHLKDERIRFVDLNQDDVCEVALESRFTGLTSLALPVELLSSDFIVSMPKLKTHHWAGITASMKNFFGVVPGAVYGWPKNILHAHGIAASILDLNATIRPHLAILDGVTGMEGDGPIMGTSRHVGLLGMSRDLVSLDATAARVIGLDPERLGYLGEAGRFLGNLDVRHIEQRGELVSRFASTFDVVDAFKAARLSPR